MAPRRTLIRIALSAVVLVACHDISTDPADALSVRLESAHYIYFHAPGDEVDTTTEEHYHAWLLERLPIAPTEKLEYRKYRSRAHLRAVTGRNTNGFAEPGTTRFHSIWPWENHENVHALVTRYLGHPPALFNEGLAVAHQGVPEAGDFVPKWNGASLSSAANDRRRAGQLPSLDDVIDSPGFFGHPEDVMYPVAGAFVQRLLLLHGWTPMKTYLANSAFDDRASETRAAFLAAYGITLDAAWAEWSVSLGAVTAPDAATRAPR